MLQSIVKKIESYLKKAYVRKLCNEAEIETRRTFYLPHFTTGNPNKPGKFLFLWSGPEFKRPPDRYPTVYAPLV